MPGMNSGPDPSDPIVVAAFRAALLLGAHCADLERQQFRAAGFIAMLSRVDRLEQALGIYDLAQFTPPDLVATS
jgi:hypothetical protein